MTIEELIGKCKGKQGDDETESILIENVVRVWAMAADVSKIAERCRNSIVSFHEKGGGVDFVIDRKAFRGVVYAFRNS